METPDETQPAIFTTADPDLAEEYSLVLSASGIPHSLNQSQGLFSIRTDTGNVHKAAYVLHLYQEENKNWPPKNPLVSLYQPVFKGMALLIIMMLMLMYSASGPWQDHSLLFEAGAGDGEKILVLGERYRLVTALTLHADPVHLAGNCAIGSFLLHFFFRTTGNGLGLTLLLFTSTIANFANVLLRGETHHFVGFSTAVFAVIGMLSTMNFSLKDHSRFLHLLMPIMGGLALLAFLGSEGVRTDITAHFFGLIAGLITGNIIRLRSFMVARDNLTIQTSLSLLSIATVGFCWFQALS